MALSDLELLELVERAQEERQGPIGPQGVGIRSIEQPTADVVIIALTDGRTKELRLTAGPKGDPGEAGKPGQDGKPGPAGSPGRAGAPGVGVAGAPGRDGTSIDTAIVNSSGNLLLGLTDGNVLDVGRVVGPAGNTGERGATGLSGKPGKDGNTILSGPHAPADNEGNPGDFWIDTSSALFDFYGKGGQGWRKLTSLRAPQTNVGGQMTPAAGGGAGGGGGSGGGELQNTATLPLANPTRYKQHGRALPPSDGLKSQKDLNEWVYSVLLSYDADGSKISVGQIPPMPTEVGMLWFSTNEDELTLYIYVDDQSGWVPAAPPVSLDGINAAIANVDEELMKVNANIAMNKRDIDEAILDVQEDQTRQDEKIAELEGEVDDLKPTVERGEWIYNADPENKNNPEVGEYHAYVVVSDDYCKSKLSECLLNAAGDPTEASKCNRDNEDCLAEIGNIDTDVPWHDVEWLVVHRNDVEGRNHTFGDVVAGMYIEAINVDGTGHGLYTINGKSLSPTRCGFQVTPVHSTGHPNGKAIIKIFKMAEAANPDDYLRKSGDTMTGRLTLERPRTDENGNSFRIKGRINGEEGANLLKDYQRATDSTSSDYIDYFGGSPNSTSLINRGYVDELKKYIFAPARYEWQARISSSGAKCPVGFVQFSGKSFADSNEIRISMTSFCKNFVMGKDGMTDQKTLYEREQGYNSAMVISAYFYKNNEWKWKGTSEIRKIIIMDQGEGFNYLKLDLDNQKYANGELFTDTHYHLTISGLF